MTQLAQVVALPEPVRRASSRRWEGFRVRLAPGITLAAFGAISGVVAAAPALGIVTSAPASRVDQISAIPWILFGVGLIVAGSVLTRDPGPNRLTGNLLILSGLIWPTGWTDAWGGGAGPLLTILGGPAAFMITITAMCRYPDPRLMTSRERIFLIHMSMWVALSRVSMILVGRPEWLGHPADSWWVTLWPKRALMDQINLIGQSGEVVLGFAFVLMWIHRARRMRGLERRLARPVVVAGGFTGLAAALSQVALVLGASTDQMAYVYGVQSTFLLAVPVALIAAAIRGRLSINAVANLVNDLSRGVTPSRLESVLRRTVEDPDLRVYFWSRQLGHYVDARGVRATVPVHSAQPGPRDRPRQMAVPVLSSGEDPLALVLTRHPSAGPPDLMASAIAASAIALENVQLQVEVQAQLTAVQAAQVRVTEAAAAERHQMERNLHDGAQQRLLAVKMTLAAAEAAKTTEAMGQLVSRARDQVGEALVELRDLARGLHPPLLSQAGLAAAVSAMTESLPLTFTVDLPSQRFPIATELTAYFVLSEGLANVVRHAKASRVWIAGRCDGDRLVITLRDDGCGGADRSAGTGLAGLTDRVNAIGGTLAIDSPTGRGTTITVGVPCA